ncbi:hypothetical protein BDY24DRAFT_382902 [Mrakia frigida]|uniref:uncharacterized protein n=1 Tax=Mrakia frigida TaxID=29902 RepID=UPI003FCBFB85
MDPSNPPPEDLSSSKSKDEGRSTEPRAPPASPPPPSSISLLPPPLPSDSPNISSDSIIPTRVPYGGLPPELWSWIMAISNTSSNGSEPHPERFESLLQFILFMDTFHAKQIASPELMACCLVSKKFYGLAIKYLYRDVTLYSFKSFQDYVKLIREDALSPDPRNLGRTLVSLDLKSDNYPPPFDVFRLPPSLSPVEGQLAVSEQAPERKLALQEGEEEALTVYDLLPYTPNLAVLLVGDEMNVKPSFFRTIELRASEVHLACWYLDPPRRFFSSLLLIDVEVTNFNLPSFLAAFTALSSTLQELGFHSTSSVLSPLPFPTQTFPSLTLPNVHSLRIRSPMTGGNGSLFRLLTNWNLPSLLLLHLDPHDEAVDQPSFLLPFFEKHGRDVQDFFFDSTFFEDFLPYVHLLPNLTSLSAYIFDIPSTASLEGVKPMFGRLKSLLAYSAREYTGYDEEDEEVQERIVEEVTRTKRVTEELDRKSLPMLEDLLWVGGKEEERGGKIIREWLARLGEEGVRTRLAIVDREEPISVFQGEPQAQLPESGENE